MIAPAGEVGTRVGARRGTMAVARREIRRILGRPLYPMLMVVLPIVSFLGLWAIFADRVPSRLPVAVLDADHSALSRRLVRMIDATRSMRVAHEIVTIDEGERIVRANGAYAILVVPANLERDVRRGTAPRLVCYYDAQYVLAASMIRRDLRLVAATLSAGIELRAREARGEPPSAALDHVEPIRLEPHALFNPQLSYMTYLLPPLVSAMLQIFVLMTSVLALGSELRDGTAREWLATAAGGPARAVLGKLLPYSVHFVSLGLLALLVLFGAVGIPFNGGAGFMALATVLFVLAVEAVAVFIVAVFVSLRLASSSAAFYSGPAFAFSGVTFPTMAMPLAAKVWGAIVPVTYYIRITVDQAIHGAPPAASLGSLAALAAFVLAVPAISIRRVGRLAADDRFWRRP